MSPQDRAAPILVACEGSVCVPAARNYTYGLCSMCGQWQPIVEPDGVVIHHRRQDLIAMIERGDFDA